MAKFYRFQSGDRGIYEAVNQDCPKEDARRAAKPDGSWIPRVGERYPGAISFWTEYGLEIYSESGLMDWHASVVNQPVTVIVINKLPQTIEYQDEYQIIFNPEFMLEPEIIGLNELAPKLAKNQI